MRKLILGALISAFAAAPAIAQSTYPTNSEPRGAQRVLNGGVVQPNGTVAYPNGTVAYPSTTAGYPVQGQVYPGQVYPTTTAGYPVGTYPGYPSASYPVMFPNGNTNVAVINGQTCTRYVDRMGNVDYTCPNNRRLSRAQIREIEARRAQWIRDQQIAQQQVAIRDSRIMQEREMAARQAELAREAQISREQARVRQEEIARDQRIIRSQPQVSVHQQQQVSVHQQQASQDRAHIERDQARAHDDHGRGR